MIDRRNIDNFGRVYRSTDGKEIPSVTTILGKQWEEGDDWDWWKRKNNGKNGNPFHKEIRNYSKWRGTLVHYACLNPLTPTELWSNDEQTAIDELQDFGTYKYHEDESRKDAFERYQQDLDWCLDRFREFRENFGVDLTNTLEVEKRFVHTTSPEYAGQFDLLYLDTSRDEVVMADIKTSKHVYDKHKYQLVAYANACEYEVDRLQVVKIHPEGEWCNKDDFQPFEVSDSYSWKEDRDELLEDFLYDAREAHNVLNSINHE